MLPSRRLLPILATLVALLLPGHTRADDVPPPLDQTQRTDGVLAVPDHFLRSWDPADGVLPRRYRSRTGRRRRPSGALRHPDPRTARGLALDRPRVPQFRPAEPWTPLRRVRIRPAPAALTLVPLLPEPGADRAAGPAGRHCQPGHDQPDLCRSGRSRGAGPSADDRTAPAAGIDTTASQS